MVPDSRHEVKHVTQRNTGGGPFSSMRLLILMGLVVAALALFDMLRVFL